MRQGGTTHAEATGKLNVIRRLDFRRTPPMKRKGFGLRTPDFGLFRVLAIRFILCKVFTDPTSEC